MLSVIPLLSYDEYGLADWTKDLVNSSGQHSQPEAGRREKLGRSCASPGEAITNRLVESGLV